MPKIIIESAKAVLVDGVNYGAVADTITNNKQLTSDVQLSLLDYEKEILDKSNKIQSDFDDYKSQAELLIAQADSIVENDKLTNDQKVEGLSKIIIAAKTPAIEKQILELKAKQDEIANQIAELSNITS